MALCLALATACGRTERTAELAVVASKIEPACGDNAAPTPVIVRGSLPVNPSVSLSSPDSTVDTTYRAWIGDHELGEVKWIDPQSLTAVVPPGLPAGVYPLTVQSPFGTKGTTDAAFRVEQGACAPQGPALVATAVVAPNTVTVGQQVTVTATVRNDGLSAAHGVSGTVVPPSSGLLLLAGPGAPQDLASGQSVDFTWTYKTTATTPGSGVTFAVDAAGTDPTGGQVTAPRATTNVLLVNPAANLTASTQAPSQVDVGQAISFELTVSNTGAAPALVVPTIHGAVTGSATLGAGTAPPPQTIPGPGQVRFVQTFTADAPCLVTFTVDVTATDVNTHLPVSVAPAAPVTVAVVQRAALATTAALAPSTLESGQTVTVTASVQNTGQATALGVAATVASAPAGFTFVTSQATARNVAGGQTAAFTFIYRADPGAGAGTFALDAAGTDANTQATVSAARAPAGPVAVRYPVTAAVSGLVGSGLVLQMGAQELAIPANGTFSFATTVASGSAYSVTVKTQPSGPSQQCAVSSGSGTVGTGPVSVVVNCQTNRFTVGGTVAMVLAGTVVLQDNGADDTVVTSNGPYRFATTIASGSVYAVTVRTQPTGQTCVVANGTGVMGATDVTNADVTCTAATHTLTTRIAGAGSGTLSCGGSPCQASYPYSTTPMPITATAATGSTFTGWSGDCTGVGPCSVVMTADRTVTATFSSP